MGKRILFLAGTTLLALSLWGETTTIQSRRLLSSAEGKWRFISPYFDGADDYQQGHVVPDDFTTSKGQVAEIRRILDGDLYMGHYHKGKRHGKGLYIKMSDQEIYNGEWANGEHNGLGVSQIILQDLAQLQSAGKTLCFETDSKDGKPLSRTQKKFMTRSDVVSLQQAIKLSIVALRPLPISEDIIPDCFRCPVTKELMRDPVLMLADGTTYDHSTFLKLLESGHTKSPLTRAKLASQTTSSLFVRNRNLKGAIEEFNELWTYLEELKQIRKAQAQAKLSQRRLAETETSSLNSQAQDFHPDCHHSWIVPTLITCVVFLALLCSYLFVKIRKLQTETGRRDSASEPYSV